MRKNDAVLLALASVLLLIVAAIIYFGVLNPARNAPRQQNDETAATRDGKKPKNQPHERPAPGPDKPSDSPKNEGKDSPEPSVVLAPRLKDTRGDAAYALIRGVTVNGDDEPMAGAPVKLMSESASALTGHGATSGPDGGFEIAIRDKFGELYEDSFCVVCLEPSWAGAVSDAFKISREAPVDGIKLVLRSPARVYGRVLDASTRDGISDATVSFEAQGRDERLTRLGALMASLRPVKTLGDGSFFLEGIPPGELTIVAGKPGWIANELNPMTRGRQAVALGEQSNVELLPFLLTRAAEVVGVVRKAPDNSPVANANVEMGTPLGGNYGSAITDAEGKYRLNAPPVMETNGRAPGDDLLLGHIELRATAPGLGIATVRVKPKAGATTTAPDLMLHAAATLTGIVVQKDETPVAGAEIYLNDTDYQRGAQMIAGVGMPPRKLRTSSGADGRFILGSLPPGALSVGVRAKGFAPQTLSVEARAGESKEVKVVLQPAGEITGLVTDQHGDAIEGVPIAAVRADSYREIQTVMRSFFGEQLPDRGQHPLFPPTIVTDEKGRYSIADLEAGPYVVIANDRLYAKHISKPLEVKVGAQVEYNITLEAGGTIFGKVFDGQQRGVSGAAVTAARMTGDGDFAVRTAFTDRMGNYEITGLSGGNYIVQRNEGRPEGLMLPNATNMAAVKVGERTRFDIYEQRPGFARLYGRVTMDGAVHAGQEVMLLGAGRRGGTVMTSKTDALGNYEFRNVPLGSYQLCDRPPGGMFPNLIRVEVLVDKAGDVQRNVDLVSVTIKGTVALEDGKLPEGHVSIYAGPASADKGKALSAVEELMAVVGTYDQKTGAFEIKGLSPGYYRVTAVSNKVGSVRKPMVDARQSVFNLHLVIARDNGTLGGAAKGLENAKPNTPMGWGGAVIIEDSTGATLQLPFAGAVRLDSDKKFTVPHLPPGSYTVTLQISGYAPSTVAGVVIETGKTTHVDFNVVTSGHAKIIVQNSELNLDEAYELTYEIRDSQGNLFKKRFTVFDFINSDGSVVQSENENAFVVRDLPQDTYTISFTHPAYQPASASFTVVAGQTVDVPVTFKKK